MVFVFLACSVNSVTLRLMFSSLELIID